MKQGPILSQCRINLFFIFLLLVPFQVRSQEASAVAVADKSTAKQTIFQHLSNDGVIKLNIKTDLRTLIRKKSEKEKQPASLTVTHPDGTIEDWKITVRARGNMRNDICYLPPLKIDFVKGHLEEKGLVRKFDDLKIVVECKAGTQYTNYLFKEYMAYKLYNMVSENSYRVQLAKIQIEDSEGKQKTMETYAFLIENDDEMAKRLGGELVETRLMSERVLHPESFDRMCLFQYLIGNTDWHVKNMHNLKIFKLEKYEKLVPIAYDFDYAGLVGTGYAVPHEKLPIASVRERFFLGPCRDKGQYDHHIEQIMAKKEEIMSFCRDFNLLDEKAKKPVISYMEEFFKILENPKKVKRQIVEHCNRHVKVG